MDYNYFPDTQPQPYHQLFSYDTELGVLPQDVTGATAFSTLDTLGQAALLPSALEGTFDEPQTYDNALLRGSISQPTTDGVNLFHHGSIDSGIGLDLDTDMLQGRRGSSEEKEMATPAQSRRKAQNRAAQRAFRERKERHVRDLEAKLNHLTTATTTLKSDNERLKILLQKVQNENEVLRASAATSPAAQPLPSPLLSKQSSNSSSEQLLRSHSSSSTNLSSRRSPAQTQLLTASATWDFLQSHPKYVSGGVDIGKVCEQLKKLARTNGSGPMFDQEEVRRVIEEVDGNGADELL
ncbi:hypothetical protein AMS68_004733 [Peltaster fructicola]|uniref:BZIP domain-containing protein n=1 Tax=Peltaster fructicola TaxID=286661 RepID=A0A6H0XX11_9PEZI|nr:hypothetical protein AMS68_004733 [Peltaster fructicola]